MKSRLLFVALLFSFCVVKPSSIDDLYEEPHNKNAYEKCVKYMKHIPSLALSAAIGAISGGFVGYFQDKCIDFPPAALFAFILSFFIEPSIRESVIDDLHEELYGPRFSQHKYRMHLSSRIFSWLAYFDALDGKNNGQPFRFRAVKHSYR